MSDTTVVIVNGGSSAGKTSLCRAFQRIAPEPFFLLGIDLFWFSMPPDATDLQTVSSDYYSWLQEDDSTGSKQFRIVPGPLLNESMLARYSAMQAYLARGLNVIADEVFWSRDWLDESLRILAPYRTYYIGAYCDPDELDRRERQRGDRFFGWARGSQHYVHQFAKYDVTIDTTTKSPERSAQLLHDFITKNPSPTAAHKMRSDLANSEQLISSEASPV